MAEREPGEEASQVPPSLPTPLLIHILSLSGDTNTLALSKDTKLQEWGPDDQSRWLLARYPPRKSLELVARSGNSAVCHALLERGVRGDLDRSAALATAAGRGHLAVCEVLISHPTHPAHADALNSVALRNASSRGDEAVCQLLLQAPTHPARASDDDSAALQAAAANGHLSICQLLLTQPSHPACADAADSRALERAAGRGHLDICRLLVSQPEHPARVHAREYAALLVAASGGHLDVVGWILGTRKYWRGELGTLVSAAHNALCYGSPQHLAVASRCLGVANAALGT